MKRHKALESLSHDHHDGLLLAVRLQQGDKALERLWSHDPLWQAEYVVRFFNDNLSQHFEEEERFVFPLAEKYFGDQIEIVHRLIKEHHEMRASHELFKHPDNENIRSKLSEFGKLLEGHIRCEEREFFPMLEEHLPENVLTEIGNQLHK